MIDITKLYFGQSSPSDKIRFRRSNNKKAVVVWTMTKKCNLECIHCYSSSNRAASKDNDVSAKILEEIIRYGPPALLLSGGEPLIHKDFFDLSKHAVKSGLKLTLSTNGTLIDAKVASDLKKVGFSYIGISLDGEETVHDSFRKSRGAYNKTLNGIKNCKQAKLNVGLRLTVSKATLDSVPHLFDVAKSENIDRLCFYHLQREGRANDHTSLHLKHAEKKWLLDHLLHEVSDMIDEGFNAQVLTVGNRFDGVYIYKKSLIDKPERSSAILDLLKTTSYKGIATGIINIDEDGSVYTDQFNRRNSIGNVMNEPIGAILDRLQKNITEQPFNVLCRGCEWESICINSSIIGSRLNSEQICYA